ncbi:MAG: DUF1552 domain-containing protein, partial [Planctomycetota bacterium]
MSLTRREILKGISLGAGAALFTPFLRSVAVHAKGDPAKLPRRFVFVMKASGVDPDHVRLRDAEGAAGSRQRDGARDVELTAEGMSPVLAPLKPFAGRVSVVRGLSGNNLKGNHTSGYGALSCHKSELTAVAPTVDALLGLKHSTGPYPMFGMATNGTLRGQASVPDDSYVYPNLSAYGAGRGVAFQASPTKAFQELFGSAVTTPAVARNKQVLNRNLMDFLKDDARRISRRLRGDDRERFDAYVSTFESLKVKESKKAALAGRVEKHAPDYVADKYRSMQHMDRMECQFELGTAALIAGLTNVVTLRPDTLGTLYGGLGFGSLGLHAIGHGATLPDGTTSAAMREKVDTYHMRLIAKMAHDLDEIPEGKGTALDNTLIVYTSCNGGKHHAGGTDWPFVLVGGAAGTLRTNRYIEYPSYGRPGHRSIGSLYLSLLAASKIEHADHVGQV